MQSIPLRAFMGAIVAIAILAAASVSALAQTFATETLTVRTSGGASHVFTVELATTSDQRALGLMNRDMMAADHGMLFDFGESRFVYMWMKNTHLPLDMLFVRQDGTIVRVAADTEPLSEAIVDSGELVYFVLELNAGTAKRLGISVGDRLDSPTIAARASP